MFLIIPVIGNCCFLFLAMGGGCLKTWLLKIKRYQISKVNILFGMWITISVNKDIILGVWQAEGTRGKIYQLI